MTNPKRIRPSYSEARVNLRSHMWLKHQVTLSADGEDEMVLCGLVRDILEAEEDARRRVQEESKAETEGPTLQAIKKMKKLKPLEDPPPDMMLL